MLLSGRRLKSRLIALGLCLIAGAFGFLVLPGRVISVADGDTLSIIDSGGSTSKIRLYGIDCPELKQAGGEAAAAFTRALAFFSNVEARRMDKDRHGRSVAIITLPDGRVLNEELLRSGHAWLYERYCKSPRCRYWKSLEAQARTEKRGLWRDKSPVPPWQWRRGKR